jgi:hypothetical protein
LRFGKAGRPRWAEARLKNISGFQQLWRVENRYGGTEERVEKPGFRVPEDAKNTSLCLTRFEADGNMKNAVNINAASVGGC